MSGLDISVVTLASYGCNVAELAEFFDLPKNEVMQILKEHA